MGATILLLLRPNVHGSIGTLTLSGGLTAVNGLTMDFKLIGTNNDAIDFGNAPMTLNGLVTIN